VSDSTAETASRPVAPQGFGDLGQYPLPVCPTEAHPDTDDDSQAAMEYGIDESKEVGNPTTIAGYGISK